MAKNRYKVRKKGGKRLIYGRTLERCAHCGEIPVNPQTGVKGCNHTKCEWCQQPLCYRYSFGLVWQDCEYGILQRRNRNTGEIHTYYFPGHMCRDKYLTILHGSEFHQRMAHSMTEWHLYWQLY